MRIKRKTLSVLLHETFVTVPATSSSHLRHSFNLISNLTTLGFRLAIGENLMEFAVPCETHTDKYLKVLDLE
jgi:hypothetical protein